MDYARTIETLTRLRSLYLGGGDDSVFTAYKTEMGASIKECGCKNKYTDAVDALLAHLQNRGALEEEMTYHLRPGVIIWLDGDCYTRHNITDDIARRWLELHPDGHKLFE